MSTVSLLSVDWIVLGDRHTNVLVVGWPVVETKPSSAIVLIYPSVITVTRSQLNLYPFRVYLVFHFTLSGGA